MQIFILEGIATSGKSTVTRELLKRKPEELNVTVYEEAQTHVPIMDKRGELNVDFFNALLEDAIGSQSDLVVFDRLYLTQAFRAKASLKEYGQLEQKLLELNAQTLFLKIDEQEIAKRIDSAVLHRSDEWAEYIQTKGVNPEEIAQTYIEQQRSQIKLLNQSKIPYKIFDTTNHNYAAIIEYILKPELRA